MEWISPHLTRKGGIQQSFTKSNRITQEKGWTMQQNAQHHSCLVSTSNILAPHMSDCHSKNSEQTCSPSKTMLGKIGNRYQAYCTTYKTHAMATHHGSAGCPVERDINIHMEDAEGINTGPDNNNDSTNGSDTTIAFRGPEKDGHPSKHFQQPSQISSSYKRNTRLTSMNRGQRKSTSRRFGLNKMGTAESFTHTSNTTGFHPITHRTFQGGNMSIHRHIVCFSKANQTNKLATTRCHCFQ